MSVKSIIPKSIDEAWAQAEKYHMVPFIKAKNSVSETFFIIMLGLDVGLTPAQALQNISILNGRPTIWGDAMLAVVYNSGLLAYHDEKITGSLEDGTAQCTCTIQRKGFEKKIYVFSATDAKRAGLWKYGTKNPSHAKLPWAAYPERMLTMRARTFALRDGFADFLKGLTSVEEAMDIPKTEEVKNVSKKDEVKGSIIKDEVKKEAKKDAKDVDVYTSKWFNEKYLIDSDGSFHLESGVIYSVDETKMLKDLDQEDKEKYHTNKLELLDESKENLFISMIKQQVA